MAVVHIVIKFVIRNWSKDISCDNWTVWLRLLSFTWSWRHVTWSSSVLPLCVIDSMIAIWKTIPWNYLFGIINRFLCGDIIFWIHWRSFCSLCTAELHECLLTNNSKSLRHINRTYGMAFVTANIVAVVRTGRCFHPKSNWLILCYYPTMPHSARLAISGVPHLQLIKIIFPLK